MKDLVKRCLGDNINADDVVDELQRQHEEAESWCLAEVKACTANLLRYYHDRLQACKDNEQSSKYPLLNTNCACCDALFCLPNFSECQDLHAHELAEALESGSCKSLSSLSLLGQLPLSLT